MGGWRPAGWVWEAGDRQEGCGRLETGRMCAGGWRPAGGVWEAGDRQDGCGRLETGRRGVGGWRPAGCVWEAGDRQEGCRRLETGRRGVGGLRPAGGVWEAGDRQEVCGRLETGRSGGECYFDVLKIHSILVLNKDNMYIHLSLSLPAEKAKKTAGSKAQIPAICSISGEFALSHVCVVT